MDGWSLPFRGLNFRGCTHSHPLRTVQSSLFHGFNFFSYMKAVKIGPLENFPLIRSAHDCHSIKIQWKELLMFFSITCKSFMGFQSCSKKMTVSAPVRLRPNPPTWVVRRRTSMEGSLLNLQKESKIDSQIRTDTNSSYTRTKAICTLPCLLNVVTDDLYQKAVWKLNYNFFLLD